MSIDSDSTAPHPLIDMSSTAHAGTWWSYAEGNATVLGAVVGVLAVAAVLFVGSRVFEQRKRRHR